MLGGEFQSILDEWICYNLFSGELRAGDTDRLLTHLGEGVGDSADLRLDSDASIDAGFSEWGYSLVMGFCTRLYILGFRNASHCVDFNFGNLRYQAIADVNCSSVWMCTGVVIWVISWS